MTRKNAPKRQPASQKRERTTRPLSSAPHQPNGKRAAEKLRQYVLRQSSTETRLKQRDKPRWRRRESPDLPPDLFPQNQETGMSKILAIILLPLFFYVLFYCGANYGASLAEDGVIAAQSIPHSMLCTSLDIAMTAGLQFGQQFDRAGCDAATEQKPQISFEKAETQEEAQ